MKRFIYCTVGLDEVTHDSELIDSIEQTILNEGINAELTLIKLPSGAVPLCVIPQGPDEQGHVPSDILAFYIPLD